MDSLIQRGEAFAEKRWQKGLSLKLDVQYTAREHQGACSLFNHMIARHLGISGMVVMVPEKMATGQILELQMTLPQEPEGEACCINMLSRVLWSQIYDDQRFVVGLQFLDLTHQDSSKFQAFLHEYKLQDGTVEAEN